MNVINFIYILIGVCLGVIGVHLFDVYKQSKRKTVAKVMLTQEQVQQVQDLINSFDLENGENE